MMNESETKESKLENDLIDNLKDILEINITHVNFKFGKIQDNIKIYQIIPMIDELEGALAFVDLKCRILFHEEFFSNPEKFNPPAISSLSNKVKSPKDFLYETYSKLIKLFLNIEKDNSPEKFQLLVDYGEISKDTLLRYKNDLIRGYAMTNIESAANTISNNKVNFI